MLARAIARTKSLWRAAKAERASPRETFWAVFVGTFVGCSPALGLHGLLALAAATALRLNRLYAWLGSRVCNAVTLPFVALAEIQLAHRVREGAFLALDRHAVLARGPELLLDWTLGSVPVGAALGAALGGLGWALARRRERLSGGTPPAAPPPSSGSTP